VRVHACLEATGAYGEALSAYLHEASHTVSVINPAAIKAYGESTSRAPRLTRPTPPSSPASARSGGPPHGSHYPPKCASYKPSPVASTRCLRCMGWRPTDWR
jgi:hypothetical protein